ncbi:hypothetical protein M8J76_014567 [Diaphorina citri]|nr:hypothetical protein M8J76_014567 [Diaphorina citri]
MQSVPYGYIDLNGDFSKLTTKEIHKTLNTFIQYGYKVVAVNTYLDLDSSQGPKPSKQKKKGIPTEDPVPSPPTYNIPENISLKIQIVSRITVKYSDPAQILKIKDSKNFKQFQIFAVQPSTVNAFSHACSTLDVDLISFSCEEKLPFSVSRKMYQVAVQRGIHFEICYITLIVSSDTRINCIQTCHALSIAGKSHNMILSSGASHPIHIRSPHEIQSVALMLGLSHVQAKQSMEAHPKSLLLRAYGRKLGKTLFDIQTLDDPDQPPSLKKLKMEE